MGADTKRGRKLTVHESYANDTANLKRTIASLEKDRRLQDYPSMREQLTRTLGAGLALLEAYETTINPKQA